MSGSARIRELLARGVDPSTLPPATGADGTEPFTEVEVPGLVLLWSRDAPQRVGEVLLLPSGDRGTWTFGRGEIPGDVRRLSLARQIPGELVSGGPLACPRISRTQIRMSASRSGGVVVQNVGSCPMVQGGRLVTSAELAPGDTISLKNELLFLCVRRASLARDGSDASEDAALPLHALGAPDAFGIVGESPAVWELRRRIVAVARKAFHVLVLGESGSGKELVAQALHATSRRGKRPIVARNAATIPEGLAAAELFGNLRSYPNPGMPERPGLVGEANGSTLFLDEFAELPPSIQAQLLRVMDEGEYQRLGEPTTRRTDLRVIAATNRPVNDIKHDVLARLKVRLTVPGLHDRREDIPLLVFHLLRRHAADDPSIVRRWFVGDVPRISPVLIEALVRHPYTTHVRELDALLVRAIIEGRGTYLDIVPELARSLPAPCATPPIEGLESLSAEETTRLALLRKHGFSPTACGRDEAYPGNRQTADLHLRQLLCRALCAADWDPRRAVDLLAGGDAAELRGKCEGRLATFIAKLRARIATEDADTLRAALAEEWKAGSAVVLVVVDALRAGKIPAPPSP